MFQVALWSPLVRWSRYLDVVVIAERINLPGEAGNCQPLHLRIIGPANFLLGPLHQSRLESIPDQPAVGCLAGVERVELKLFNRPASVVWA